MSVKEKEVREGYKMTELSEIPVEWEVKSFGQIFKLKSGDHLPGKSIVEGDIPVYGGNGIVGHHNKWIYSDAKIIIGRVGAHCGNVYYSNSKAWITDNALFICEKLYDFDNEFMFYLLKHRDLNSFANKNAQPLISGKIIYSILTVYPPLPEQQKIAEILSTVDEQLETIEGLIDRTKELKKGLMQRLLTKGIGHTEFKQTELGEIPVGWEVYELSDLIDIIGGHAFKSKDATEFGVPWLKIANVGLGKIIWNEKSYLPERFLLEFTHFQIKYNDIVMAMTRPILRGQAKVSIYKEKNRISLLNQRVCKIIPKKGLDKSYLYHYLTSSLFSKSIEYLIAGTDPPNVSSQQIKSIKFSVPMFKEQQKIASILSSVDEQIDTYEQEKEKVTELKKGLMQQLLTGKVRVTV